MDQRPRIFDILRRCDDLAADQALVTGVLRVTPEHQREIVAILLERANEHGLRALPTLFHNLDAEAQSLIIANTSRLFAPLRASIRSSNSQTRLNTLEIIRRSGSLRLGYLVAFAIHDGSPKVRAEAAGALQQLAKKHCQNYAETTGALRDATEPDGSLSHAIVQTLKLLRDERRYLVTAIQEALHSYESHYRPEVIEAAMFLADELESDLFEHSTLKRGKLTHAMHEVYTGTVSPGLVPFTYVALCYPELRRRIVSALATNKSTGFFAEFIRHHWLARDPAIRKNLIAVRSLAWLKDGLDAAFSLPEDVAAMAPAWLLHLGLPSEQKVALLLNFLLIDSPPVNRAAVWALVNINTPASTLALQGLLDHDDAHVAKTAQREIENREHRQDKLIRKPPKDRPEAWVRLLHKANLAEDFDDIWRHFDRLHPAQSKAAGHYAPKHVPGFMTQTQVKLLSPHALDRLRALRLVITLHVADKFQNDIFAMANDSVPEIRAVTMTALGHIGDATSRRILERAINDDSDSAVQAAAIDALDHLGARQRADVIAPKTDSENPDVRASAIRALLRLHIPQAAAALISMLQDQRPEHRCAALWIVDQLRLVTVLPRLLEMEATDGDTRIARIAKHVGKRLKRLQGSSTEQPHEIDAPTAKAPEPAEVAKP
ncbi:MAG: HEAT repeat domain-containing protein [Phycisphaerae bacterium]|nr:HEAT repeat domain-containing protein [Phycisphaerae bacterium]